jgi:hypothetical protein
MSNKKISMNVVEMYSSDDSDSETIVSIESNGNHIETSENVVQINPEITEEGQSIMAAQENIKLNEIFDFDDCPICFEDFDEKKHKKVTCGCTYSICISCAKECMVQIEKDPHCIHCKRGWNRDFLYANIGKKFINKDFKDIRKKLLFEQEKNHMPATMLKVVEYKNMNKYKKEKQVIDIEIGELRNKLYILKARKRVLQGKIWRINRGTYTNEGDDKNEPNERKRFIKPCPAEKCRGFLSTGYKCELCNIKVCSKCLEIKVKDEEHTCKEENIKNAELIRKETKPCPKCGVPIFKISGCDQMWCTQCNIAFSWNKGTVVTGVIHNPHYYEYMKNNNIQNPGVQLCGGNLTYRQVIQISNNIKNSKININTIQEINKIYYSEANFSDYSTSSSLQLRNMRNDYQLFEHYHRVYNHILGTVIDPLRIVLRMNNDNEKLRLRYITNEISEKEFITQIAKKENIREKKRAMLQVLELLLNVLLDNIIIFGNKYSDKKFNIKDKKKDSIEFLNDLVVMMRNIYTVRIYCNEQLERIAFDYNMKVHYIPDNLNIAYKLKDKQEMKELNVSDKERSLVIICKDESTIVVYDPNNKS